MFIARLFQSKKRNEIEETYKPENLQAWEWLAQFVIRPPNIINPSLIDPIISIESIGESDSALKTNFILWCEQISLVTLSFFGFI